MAKGFPRRSLFQVAGAAALLRSRVASAQQPVPGQATVSRRSGRGGRGMPITGNRNRFRAWNVKPQ